MKKYKSLFAVLVALICAVVVTSCEDPLSKSIPVNSVNLSTSAAELTEGESLTLTATVLPENATNKNVTWTSSNTDVASVTNGTVTALKPGTSTITVTTEDGQKTASCVVTVVARVYPVASVALDKTSAELTEGESLTLTATIFPENATNKNVLWKSSNADVASVTNGIVTAHKPGSSTITVTTEDGSKSASCVMTVVYGNNSGNNESVDENNGLW